MGFLDRITGAEVRRDLGKRLFVELRQGCLVELQPRLPRDLEAQP